MRRRNLIVGGATAAFVMAALMSAYAGQVQPAAAPALFTRAILLQATDLSAPGHQVVQAMAEIKPGGESGRHTHPGEEIFHVLVGPFLLERDGVAPRTFQTGESFVVPKGTIHNAKNTGTATVRVLATYVIESGKPVTTNLP